MVVTPETLLHAGFNLIDFLPAVPGVVTGVEYKTSQTGDQGSLRVTYYFISPESGLKEELYEEVYDNSRSDSISVRSFIEERRISESRPLSMR
ncbi:MAG TPA: hypothetical protein P5277_02625 [Candidatus Paceibacterota bacterium]|nr:hypothetical protein [Candidatus Paceibacterota bacterium]